MASYAQEAPWTGPEVDPSSPSSTSRTMVFAKGCRTELGHGRDTAWFGRADEVIHGWTSIDEGILSISHF